MEIRPGCARVYSVSAECLSDAHTMCADSAITCGVEDSFDLEYGG